VNRVLKEEVGGGVLSNKGRGVCGQEGGPDSISDLTEGTTMGRMEEAYKWAQRIGSRGVPGHWLLCSP
jgi:hypothetical protein